MRLRRRSPADELDFELSYPEGLVAHRDIDGFDLTVSAGDPQNVEATVVAVRADRQAAPVTLEQHVNRTRAEPATADAHLVDEAASPAPVPDAWWMMHSAAVPAPGYALIVDQWMFVRDGVGWTVSVRTPWASLHQTRDGAVAIASTFRFR